MDVKEPEFHPLNQPSSDAELTDIVEKIEALKPLLADGLCREEELNAIEQRAFNAYEYTADHDSIQYRKYDRSRREVTRYRAVHQSGYVNMSDAHELLELQQQIVELLNLHDVDVQPTELFVAPRTPFTARTYLRNILSRAQTSIDIKDDYLFSARGPTYNVELLNILQPYMSTALNITVRLLGSDQSPPNVVVSDVKAFVAQFPAAEFKGITPVSGPRETHDRFIIIDGSEVYKVGTSVKDLGSAQSAIDKVDDSTIAQQYIVQFDTWWTTAHDYPNLT